MANEDYDTRSGRGGEREDLVLAPGEFAYILDKTKGHVNVLVGPNKTPMSNNDAPVNWNPTTRRFVTCDMNSAKQVYPSAPEGSYMVLRNPVQSGQKEHPLGGTSSTMVDLQIGRTINIPGPANFPLWPAQTAEVISGHRLRSNQYLVGRIYNDDEAEKNWERAVVKPQTGGGQNPEGGQKPDDEKNAGQDKSLSGTVATEVKSSVAKPHTITMGQLIIIKGTDVSFYIPPTGVEVVPDSQKEFVRNAVTLERLEYCILLGENGTKRFVEGPAVVFPEPTETFVAKDGRSKFRAIELNPNSGIYVKVIADYEEGETKFKTGQELFITGKDQAIYYPRTEHAIIKYGTDDEIYYAVVVPEGEGRYVLNKDTGKVSLVRGPTMLLPDPRKEVIVRRILSQNDVELWFPGNNEAIRVNKSLADQSEQEKGYLLSNEGLRSLSANHAALLGDSERTFAGESLSRKTTFTPPRTITLNTKYDGAVTIDVHTGYAVLVVSKTGKRKVVVGPQTILLEYNERLMALELSTGKPKTTDRLMKTVYLKVQGNTVSDLVYAETKDLVKVKIKVSYRVNFEGEDSEKWFSVENYVKFLTDHVRSRLRAVVKRVGIEQFHGSAADVVRDTVLGVHVEGAQRAGCSFSENGMRVYDVEVLSVEIDDEDIGELLQETQHFVVEQTLTLAKSEKELDVNKQLQAIKQQEAKARAKTVINELVLRSEGIKKKLEVDAEEVKAQAHMQDARLKTEKETQGIRDEIAQAVLLREKAVADQRLAIDASELEQRIKELTEQTKAVVDRAGAIQPDFVAALHALGNKDVVTEIAKHLGPIAMLSGSSVSDVFTQLTKGTSVEGVMQFLSTRVPLSKQSVGDRSGS